MNNLINVTNQDGVLVVSSREVAENFEKRHDHIMRDIGNLINDMGSPQNWGSLFIPSTYIHEQNKQEYQEYLLTRDGFTLLAMGFTGKKALDWKLKYIEAFNKMEQTLTIGLQNLSPELQMFQQIFNAVAKQELEVKQAKELSQRAIDTSQVIKDTIIGVYDNWRAEMKHLIANIQKSSDFTYQDLYNRLYDDLEKRARCDLSARIRNGRQRLRRSGATKTQIDNYCRMDVIEANARLKEIFTTIVKEYVIKYVA